MVPFASRATVAVPPTEDRGLVTAALDSLKPGGYLVVGTSERVADPRALGLTSPFHFIYRKG